LAAKSETTPKEEDETEKPLEELRSQSPHRRKPWSNWS